MYVIVKSLLSVFEDHDCDVYLNLTDSKILHLAAEHNEKNKTYLEMTWGDYIITLHNHWEKIKESGARIAGGLFYLFRY